MTPGQHAAPGIPRTRGRSDLQILVAAAVLAFLGFVTPFWLWSELPARSEIELSSLLGLLLVEACAVRLAWLSYAGRPQLMAITFYVFVYVWGGLSAFAQNYAWIYPWPRHHTADQAVAGVLQILLAVAAYELGRWFTTARTRSGRLTVDISLRGVTWVCLAAIPLAAVGVLLLGGPQILLTPRAEFDARGVAATGSKALSLIAPALLRSPPFVAFVLAALVCVRRWPQLSRTGKRTFLALLLVLAAVNVFCNYPVSLARYWLGTILLTPVFALIPWRRSWVGGLVLGLVATMVFVFPYTDAFRNARSGSNFTRALDLALSVSVVDNILAKPDYDVFQMTVNADVVSDELGHSWGKNFAGAALFWFPRSLWEGKPEGTGHIIGRHLKYIMINLSAPLWTEAYWAFGWLGIALLLWLYGYGSALLDRAFEWSRQHPRELTAAAFATPFGAAYQFIVLRGDLLNVVSLSSVAILVFLASARVRRPRSALRAEAGTAGIAA